jgi:glutathione S-transferase
MSSLRLWSWHLSPFAGKVRVAFAEKGVEVELIEIDPRHRPARLRELNPTNRVPVLEVDGHAIPESSVICDWLDDVHPEPPLWPADPGARAVARGRMRWVDDELTRNFFLSMRKEAFGLDDTDHPEVVAHLRSALKRRWAVAEGLLGHHDGHWLMGGAQPSLADLAAVPLAVRLPQWRADLAPDADTYPLTAAWLAQLRERPSAAAVDHRGEPAPA